MVNAHVKAPVRQRRGGRVKSDTTTNKEKKETDKAADQRTQRKPRFKKEFHALSRMIGLREQMA